MKKLLSLAILGLLFVSAVSAQSAVVNLDAAIEQANKDINNALRQGSKVALFCISSSSDSLSNYVLEEISIQLVRSRKLTVVDSREVERIRRDMNFPVSGELSDESAQRVGLLLGAQYLVLGSLVNMGQTHRFRTRVINVSNTAIETALSINVSDDSQIQYLLGQGGRSPVSQPVVTQGSSPASSANTSTAEKQASTGKWYNSYAPGIDSSKALINVGIGIGPTRGYDFGIPPISASVDIKLPVDVPITVGPTVALTTWGWSSAYTDVTYWNVGIGGRGMYHFNFVQNLDVYGGLVLGYVVQWASVTTSVASPSHASSNSFFLWGFTSGARYFFSKALGVYLELGYSGLQYASAGLTFKF